MNLQDYLGIFRRRWLSILIVTIAGVVVGVGVTYTSPKVYSASAQSFVALTAPEGGNNANPLSGAQFAAQRVKSYTELSSSPEVLEPVIAQLELPYSAQALAGKITATNPPNTVLLVVTAQDGSPEMAARIANAAAVHLGLTIERLETPIGSTKPPVKVTVVEPAIAPSSPSSPRGNVNLALGFILGLGLGVGWALIREQLDRTVKSTDQLGELTGAPNLGVVLFDDDASANHVSALDTRSVKSEGYRTIRTNMQFVSIDDPVSSVVVTSAVPNDGKTTISCNLAVALAQGGHKVCLMEADLRNAQVGPFLGISPAVGLTDVLSGRQSLENALVKWGRGLIDVLPAGKAPPNPSELLSSKHMAILIDQLEKQYDYVIIDSAPLLLVSDAAQLAAHAGGALLVVRYGQTSRDAVTRAATALAQVNARMLGTVINAMPAKRRGYGYGYGYGYGASSKDSDRADAKEPDAREPTSPSAGPR